MLRLHNVSGVARGHSEAIYLVSLVRRTKKQDRPNRPDEPNPRHALLDVGLEADPHSSNIEVEDQRIAISIWTFPLDALAIQRFGRG
jgi:hypothetical protein